HFGSSHIQLWSGFVVLRMILLEPLNFRTTTMFGSRRVMVTSYSAITREVSSVRVPLLVYIATRSPSRCTVSPSSTANVLPSLQVSLENALEAETRTPMQQASTALLPFAIPTPPARPLVSVGISDDPLERRSERQPDRQLGDDTFPSRCDAG